MYAKLTSRNDLLALPWGTIPRLTAGKICAYTQATPGKKHISDWLKTVFDYEDSYGSQMADQFLYMFYDVMNASVDARDRGIICLSDVPTTGEKSWLHAPYGSSEVAAWWNAVVDRIEQRFPK